MERPFLSKGALVARLLGVGWFVALSIAGCAIGGLALDARLNSTPLLTVVGILLGITISGIGTYRMVRAVLNGSAGSK